jgi:hypothetical protein
MISPFVGDGNNIELIKILVLKFLANWPPVDSFSACGFPQEFLHTDEEKLTFRQENLTTLEEKLTFQSGRSLETRMDRGFQACG